MAAQRPDYPGQVTDPEQLRISDADRHRVAEVLREAAGEGRLDLDELDERLEAAYAAKVYADLVPILADLPGSHLPAVADARQRRLARTGSAAPAPRIDSSIAIMGGSEPQGRLGGGRQAHGVRDVGGHRPRPARGACSPSARR